MVPLTYETVTEAVNELQERGYNANLAVLTEKECLICHTSGTQLSADEFEIDEIYRFEGNTDPGDEMIVFAVSSKKHELKGVVVNAFGTYSDGIQSKLIEKLEMRKTPGYGHI